MKSHPLTPGDLLSRSKGLVTHYGIAVDSYHVLEILPWSTSQIVGLEQFSEGQPVRLRQPQHSDRAEIVARAWQVASNGKPYNLATYNCEHVKNFALTGAAYSETARLVGFLILIGVIGVAARAVR